MRRRYDDGVMPNAGSDRRSYAAWASTNGTVTGAEGPPSDGWAPNACGGRRM
ncbi:MAG: hypothetical protein IPQ18_12705 [Saprospiraceae bacterium]|nr:hypothetical protein [Saprospiraceae bacterium]